MHEQALVNPLVILVPLIVVYLENRIRRRMTGFGIVVGALLGATFGYFLSGTFYYRIEFFQTAIVAGIVYGVIARFVLTKTKLLD